MYIHVHICGSPSFDLLLLPQGHVTRTIYYLSIFFVLVCTGNAWYVKDIVDVLSSDSDYSSVDKKSLSATVAAALEEYAAVPFKIFKKVGTGRTKSSKRYYLDQDALERVKRQRSSNPETSGGAASSSAGAASSSSDNGT